MYINLIKDTTLLLAIVLVVSYIKSLYAHRLRDKENWLLGLTYGALSIITMHHPFVFQPGFIFDARGPFIALSGLFGGPIAAVISGFMASAFRVYIAGPGMFSGVMNIAIAGLLGVGLHFYSKRRETSVTALQLILLGITIAACSFIVVALFMPGDVYKDFLTQNGLWLTGFFMLVCLIFGLFESLEVKRRERDRALRENEVIFENVQRVGQVGVWIYFIERGEFKISTQIYRIMGLEPHPGGTLSVDEVLGFVHPDDTSRFRDQISAIIGKNRGPEPFQFRFVQPNASVRTVWSHALTTPADIEKLSDGRISVGLLHDVTEKNQMFDQLAHSARLATLGELASTVGHEINNPLTAALLFNDRIERKLKRSGASIDSEIFELIDRLGQRLQGISSLVKSMTSFVRLESRQQKPIDAHGVIMDTLGLFQELVPAEKVALEVDLLAERHEIVGDPARLQQVLMNLLVNARDATEGLPHAAIRIETQATHGSFELSVGDNGRGMDEDVRRRVFEPFFTTKGKGHGTGLGLSIASSIVSDMQGFINVDSAPGAGATFKLSFPLPTENSTTP